MPTLIAREEARESKMPDWTLNKPTNDTTKYAKNQLSDQNQTVTDLREMCMLARWQSFRDTAIIKVINITWALSYYDKVHQHVVMLERPCTPTQVF